MQFHNPGTQNQHEAPQDDLKVTKNPPHIPHTIRNQPQTKQDENAHNQPQDESAKTPQQTRCVESDWENQPTFIPAYICKTHQYIRHHGFGSQNQHETSVRWLSTAKKTPHASNNSQNNHTDTGWEHTNPHQIIK